MFTLIDPLHVSFAQGLVKTFFFFFYHYCNSSALLASTSITTTFNLQDIEKEISELKMSVNTRGRLVATEFLKQFI